MAQVTMTGKEYADLLNAENRYLDLMSKLTNDRKVHFNNREDMSYWDGDWPDVQKYPNWALDFMYSSMESWLLNLPEDEFTRWVKKGNFVYDPVGKRFSSWETDNGIDMRKYSSLIDKRCQVIENGFNSDEQLDL